MFAVLIFGLSMSIDALGIGVSYGVRNIKIPIQARIIIAFISAMMTAVSIWFGEVLGSFLPIQISKWIGILLLFFMGVWVIIQGVRLQKKETNMDDSICLQDEKTVFQWLIKSMGITIKIIKNPKQGDINQSFAIEPIEAFYIGVALSIDSLGVGIAIGTMSLHSIWIPIAVACGQFLFLSIGGFVGKKVPNGKPWVFVSGCLLIMIALLRIF